MKTISVKQVAAALDITPRAVIYRLEKNQLKGSQSPNAFGKQEWRVYPTKEIVEGLKRNSATVESARKEAIGTDEFNFSPEDIEIAEAHIVFDGSTEAGAEGSAERSTETQVEGSVPTADPRDWQTVARDTVQSIAEELVRPLGEIIKRQEVRLAEQEEMLADRDLLIEEKDRQLRLLPDLEKQAEDRLREAEQRRKEAEDKELEANALAKQIVAMKDQQQTSIIEAERLARIESETLPALVRQLEQERLQKEKDVAEAMARLSALESEKREVEEAKAKLEESLQREIDRLKEEKGDQAKAIQSQFELLNQKLEKLEKPQQSWWKKFFSVTDKDTNS